MVNRVAPSHCNGSRARDLELGVMAPGRAAAAAMNMLMHCSGCCSPCCASAPAIKMRFWMAPRDRLDLIDRLDRRGEFDDALPGRPHGADQSQTRRGRRWWRASGCGIAGMIGGEHETAIAPGGRPIASSALPLSSGKLPIARLPYSARAACFFIEASRCNVITRSSVLLELPASILSVTWPRRVRASTVRATAWSAMKGIIREFAM